MAPADLAGGRGPGRGAPGAGRLAVPRALLTRARRRGASMAGMRVLIVAVGSRGDVAPFTGLATALNAAGHTTVIAGYEMFGGLVTGCGLEFRPLPGDPRMLDAARWQRGGTGPLGAARLIRLIAEHMRELHAGMLAAVRQGTDVLLLAGLSYAGGYHIAEGLGLPSMSLQLAPVAPTRDFAPSIVTARSLGRWGNLAAGHALVLLGAPALAGPVRELRAELGLPRLSSRQAIYGRMNDPSWPVFHGFSPRRGAAARRLAGRRRGGRLLVAGPPARLAPTPGCGGISERRPGASVRRLRQHVTG